ncbi:hypothetical protein [Haloarcula amylovorans]|uniref:hypothetical protein n=1 Tax=Haloarcula amylovorans TaxID=2562280 RepID=UPI001ADD83E9|nr:hypothetical protein [Halomicroarcula amylolytica]
MGIQSESDSETTEEDTMSTVDDVAESTPLSMGDPVATLAAGSILYSWYKFYVEGNKEGGIFVGLWAPTLLAGASYLQQKDVIQSIKRGVASF